MSLWQRETSWESPLPSMGGLDYDSTMKFMEAIDAHCGEHELPLDDYYDWVIHTLLSSLMCDSPSRMFLSRADTAPFDPEELFPFSAVTPAGQKPVELAKRFVIAPLWNNQGTFAAIDRMERETVDGELPDGLFVPELNLAIITHRVHELYFDRFRLKGAALLSIYRLADMAAAVDTDGREWTVTQPDGTQVAYDVSEPRMAALYKIAQTRFLNKDK